MSDRLSLALGGTFFFQFFNLARGEKFVNLIGRALANALDLGLALAEGLGIVRGNFVLHGAYAGHGLFVGNAGVGVTWWNKQNDEKV